MTSPLPKGVATFLFTDIEGSTRLAVALGDSWLGVLETHNEVLREVFPRYGGVEVKTVGDSFFVAFADAGQAVAASVAMQRAVAAHDWSPHQPIKIRMGLHTGPATVHDNDYVGLTIHAAARIESAAAGEQILISSATLEAAGTPLPDDIDVLDLGLHRLKDLPADVHIFQVLADGLTRDFPPVRGIDVLRNNVPVPASTFIGRAEQLAKLHEQLDRHRLVTLVGPGGAGKTRLALKLANERLFRYGDGVWFVELDPASDEETTVSVFADVLGVREQPGRSLLDAVVTHIHDFDVLFVVDNTEHVIDAAARAVEAVLQAGPGVRVLATSREPLAISGERLWPVPPLSVEEDPGKSEAVQLLVERISLVQPDFVLDRGTAETALSIARALDGMPLALELAAASAASLPLQEVARQLDDRFALLTGGSRTALDRQKTLWGAIDWSYGLLDEGHRAAFRQLGVFPSRFDVESVVGVCGEGVAATIATLQAKSLLFATPTGRLRMFESIRAYAREQLANNDELAAMAARHARWFQSSLLSATEKPAWAQDIHAYESVWDDLTTALEWMQVNDPPTSLPLFKEMSEYSVRRGRYSEARRFGQRVLSATEGVQNEDRAKVLARLADAALAQGDSNSARACFMESVEVLRAIESPRADFALGDLGLVAAQQGDLALAEEMMGKAEAAARARNKENSLALILVHLAEFARRRGDLDLAWSRAEEARSLLEEHAEDERVPLAVDILMGSLADARGDPATAQQQYEAAITATKAVDDSEQLPYLLFCVATLALDQGQADRAASALREAITLGRDLDARADLAESLEATARVAVERRALEIGRQLLAAADALRTELEFPRPPADLPRYEALLAHLGDTPVVVETDLERAIALALDLLA